ncbi:MAG: hypothetical protein IKN83_11355 [Bacteroidaceae bacterium]|nr:hypothetical protein [Bacteroidaceae bacterium]
MAKQNNIINVGDFVRVKTLEEFRQTPNELKRRRKFWHSYPGKSGVFNYSLMRHLCGGLFQVVGINRKGLFVIHDEAGSVFTLASWMLSNNQ